MKYTSEELAVILEKHNKWLQDSECKDGERADFHGADLTSANLTGANLISANLKGATLSFANLIGANLARADLRNANLEDADLEGANLEDADLEGANLRCTDLTDANLIDADLTYVNLRGTDLTDAYLIGADLRYADLTDASLTGADLTDADLLGVDLRGANLEGTDLIDADLTDAYIAASVLDDILPKHCPQNGAFIGWKKVLPPCRDAGHDNLIAKLLIPEDAKRTNSTTRKCRCDRATVLELQKLDGSTSEYISARSIFDPEFEYIVGKEVKPLYDFDEDRRTECASGIHFFMTREEAVKAEFYMF